MEEDALRTLIDPLCECHLETARSSDYGAGSTRPNTLLLCNLHERYQKNNPTTFQSGYMSTTTFHSRVTLKARSYPYQKEQQR